MSFWTTFVLALGVSADAFAVARSEELR